MLTGELKAVLIKELQEMVADIQKRRAVVDDALVEQFMTPRPLQYSFWTSLLKWIQ